MTRISGDLEDDLFLCSEYRRSLALLSAVLCGDKRGWKIFQMTIRDPKNVGGKNKSKKYHES